MKILLLLPNNFSDSLLATPVLRCLHRLPEAKLFVLTGTKGKSALTGNHFVQQVFVWNGNASPTEAIETGEFSIVIDLQNNNESKAMLATLSVKTISIPTHSVAESLYHFTGWRLRPKQQLVEHYFEAVAPLNVFNDDFGLDYFIPGGAAVQSHDIPHSHHAGFVCISVGALRNGVRLSVRTLQTICGRLAHPIVLLGTKEDAAKGETIAAIDNIKIYNACGKFSLDENADLIRQSKLLVTANADEAQVAAALKKEAVVIGGTKSFYSRKPYYGEKFLRENPSPYDTVNVRMQWFGSFGTINIDALLNKVALRLRRKKEQ